LTLADDKAKRRYGLPGPFSRSVDAMSEEEDYQILGLDFEDAENNFFDFGIPGLQPDAQNDDGDLPFLY